MNYIRLQLLHHTRVTLGDNTPLAASFVDKIATMSSSWAGSALSQHQDHHLHSPHIALLPYYRFIGGDQSIFSLCPDCWNDQACSYLFRGWEGLKLVPGYLVTNGLLSHVLDTSVTSDNGSKLKMQTPSQSSNQISSQGDHTWAKSYL